MKTCRSLRVAACAASIVVIFASTSSSGSPRDRKAPTRPTNLRITGTTAWGVSLAWSPSTDASPFTYKVQSSGGQTVTVPQTATSMTFTEGFQHRWTYSFLVYAVDSAGNRSSNSNSVTVTLPRDTIAPSAPVLSVIDAGPTHTDLAWSSTDDGPFIFYTIYRDGMPVTQGTSATSIRVYFLEPQTTYTFTAKARDNGINWSALSQPVSITTEAANPNDTTPPSSPTNLFAGDFGDGSTEFEARWTASVDDFDPADLIRYDLYVNGVYLSSTVGRTRINDYGVFGENLIEVIAVDTAGNESAPASYILDIP